MERGDAVEDEEHTTTIGAASIHPSTTTSSSFTGAGASTGNSQVSFSHGVQFYISELKQKLEEEGKAMSGMSVRVIGK